MKIHFDKYHGTSNDFIMIDNRTENFPLDNFQLIKAMCKIKTGIGADGLIVIAPAANADFTMHYYNADGKPGSMCGNGGRCAVAFGARQNFFASNEVKFMAYDGIHSAKLDLVNGTNKSVGVTLTMNNVDSYKNIGDDILLDTGSPHYVTFLHVISNLNVIKSGRSIRYSNAFEKEGVNVNFVQTDGNDISIRTYERGVEAETLSCGTGATASAIATSIVQNKTGEIHYKVKTRGGNLDVRFHSDGKSFSDITLTGDAVYVFSGEYEI